MLTNALSPAKCARDDITRQRFLELAKLWRTAAQQLDDGMSVPLAPEAGNHKHR